MSMLPIDDVSAFCTIRSGSCRGLAHMEEGGLLFEGGSIEDFDFVFVAAGIHLVWQINDREACQQQCDRDQQSPVFHVALPRGPMGWRWPTMLLLQEYFL